MMIIKHDDVPKEQPPLMPPPQPQTHKKVWLFGVCISSDENVHPQTHEKPQSNPSLERPFQDISPQPIPLPTKRLIIRWSNRVFVDYKSQQLSQSAVLVHKKRKSKAKGKIVKNEAEPCPQLLPPRILQQIQRNGGTPPIFLFKKRLTSSDVESDQNQLFLSRKRKPMRKLMEFLTELERNEVDNDGAEFLTIDPKGDNHILHLKRWRSMPMFILKTEWSKLVTANKLEEDDRIQLWGYRQHSKLRLAVHIKKVAKKGAQGDGSTSTKVDGSGSSSGCGWSIFPKA